MSSDDPDVASLEALASALRRAIALARVTTAPAALLERARAAIDEAAGLLEPHRHPGPFMQAGLGIDPARRLQGAGPDSAPHAVFPYSPVIGRRNPLAPPVPFEVVDGVVRGEVVFGPVYNGPPGSVHGGVIALVFDELLGYVNVANQSGAFTGTLSVRYVRMTPIGVPIRMEARTERVDGRKVFSSGAMFAGDELTAEAEGVFIRPASAPA